MSWQSEMDELRRREAFAEQLGGPARVQRQHDGGRYTIRERIDKLVDAGTFHELGKIAGMAEYDEHNNLKHFTPSNFVVWPGQAGWPSRGGGGGRFHCARRLSRCHHQRKAPDV